MGDLVVSKYDEFSSVWLQRGGIKEAHSPSYITAVKDGKTHCFEIASEDFGWHKADWQKTPEQIEWERMVAEADNYRVLLVHLTPDDPQIISISKAA